MKPENFDIDELIQDLTGTCKNISDFLPDGMIEEDLTQDDLNKIDQEIFLCPTCGWWCEQSEANRQEEGDEEVCDDCINQ